MIRGFSYDTISGGFYSKDKLAGNGVGQISRNRVGTFTGNLTTRLILGAEMGDAFTARLGMKYGGSTVETDLDLIHKFMQTGNLLFRAGLSWSI